MMRIDGLRFFSSGLAAAVLILATYLVPPEARTVREAASSKASIVLQAAYAPPGFARAAAVQAQVRQMSACDDLMAAPMLQVAGEHAVRNLAAACSARAEEVLKSSPTLSVAHLVRARALHNLRQPGPARDVLIASTLTGRNEGWLAARRVRQQFDMGLPVDQQLLEAARADVLTVAADGRYFPLLAELYTAHPQLRGWLECTLHDSRAHHRKRFAWLVKSQVKAGRHMQ